MLVLRVLGTFDWFGVLLCSMTTESQPFLCLAPPFIAGTFQPSLCPPHRTHTLTHTQSLPHSPPYSHLPAFSGGRDHPSAPLLSRGHRLAARAHPPGRAHGQRGRGRGRAGGRWERGGAKGALVFACTASSFTLACNTIPHLSVRSTIRPSVPPSFSPHFPLLPSLLPSLPPFPPPSLPPVGHRHVSPRPSGAHHVHRTAQARQLRIGRQMHHPHPQPAQAEGDWTRERCVALEAALGSFQPTVPHTYTP